MNVEEYISSGIIENYVLGLANEAERAGFQEMCLLHPEVKAASILFEESLQKNALQNAIVPPAHIRQALLDHLGIKDAEIIPPQQK